MKKVLLRRPRLGIVLLLLGLLLVATTAVVAHQPAAAPVASVKQVVCSDKSAEDFNCWWQHYALLTKQKSPEAAFADFKQASTTTPYVKANCHQLAHVIGRAAAQKYGTLAKTFSHGDNFCWSGYYHGAVETVAAKIGPAKITTQLNSVCAAFLKAKPYSFDHYNCVHGMGHGVMAVEDDNLFTALDICGDFAGDWQQESCYGGVFMENTMNELKDSDHPAYFKADDLLYPCTAVENRYKQQCYLMQTSHALTAVHYDYQQVFALCATVAAPYDSTCFQSLGRDVSGQSSSDQQLTIEHCMLGLTEPARRNCFTGAVKDFLSYFHSDKQGLALCAAIPDANVAADCAATARAYYKTF